jgi:sugar lactone lactonase YvrE
MNDRVDWHNFRIDVDEVTTVASGLHRPECVLCTGSGDLYVSHRAQGVTQIDADGRQRAIGHVAEVSGHELIPNGIALLPDGRFLIANIGEAGGAWSLDRSGHIEPFLLEVDGQALSAANFVANDAAGRIWITVSTTSLPRFKAYSDKVADGFVALVDAKGARIVADGLAFTNECRIGPDGAHLYVSETFGRRIRRFPLRRNHELGPGEVFAQFDRGNFPDGCEFDEEGGLWVTSIVSNRLYRVDRDGRAVLVLEDSEPGFIEEVETALREGRMGREHFYTVRSRKLKNIASIAFGGPDRRTAYMGSLLGDSLYSFRAPVAGRRPVHWAYAG